MSVGSGLLSRFKSWFGGNVQEDNEQQQQDEQQQQQQQTPAPQHISAVRTKMRLHNVCLLYMKIHMHPQSFYLRSLFSLSLSLVVFHVAVFLRFSLVLLAHMACVLLLQKDNLSPSDVVNKLKEYKRQVNNILALSLYELSLSLSLFSVLGLMIFVLLSLTFFFSRVF